jgi:hypothetical protein
MRFRFNVVTSAKTALAPLIPLQISQKISCPAMSKSVQLRQVPPPVSSSSLAASIVAAIGFGFDGKRNRPSTAMRLLNSLSQASPVYWQNSGGVCNTSWP